MGGMLHRLAQDPRFALAELLLVLLSAGAWAVMPRLAMGFTVSALVPLGIRVAAGAAPFQRTRFDALMGIFLITAWIAYWAAYDQPAAWTKLWLVMTAILLYYTLGAQPEQNQPYLSLISFALALGLVVHLVLTHEFGPSSGAVGNWWMSNRPRVNWAAGHPGNSTGLLLLTGLFSFGWPAHIKSKMGHGLALLVLILFLVGMAAITGAFLRTRTGGAWMILLGCTGALALGCVSKVSGRVPKIRALFPPLVLACLALALLFRYADPVWADGSSTSGSYGANGREEVLARSAYLLADFPFTGGGLGSFPGLYSQYILGIPHYYFSNSYNLFLDIAIEQGLVAGLIILTLYLVSAWQIAGSLVEHTSQRKPYLGWLSLLALLIGIVSGSFYDYLYQGPGITLLLAPVGISIMALRDHEIRDTGGPQIHSPKSVQPALAAGVAVFTLMAAMNISSLRAAWYANLGAIKMAQVELHGFPTGEWAGAELLPSLEKAQNLLNMAVQYNPANPTANYRLGRISLLRQDFLAACRQLEAAYQEAPNHRGVVKTLAYCYVWRGRYQEAGPLLRKIPEASQELHTYVGWWKSQGRPDLSDKANKIAAQLDAIAR